MPQSIPQSMLPWFLLLVFGVIILLLVAVLISLGTHRQQTEQLLRLMQQQHAENIDYLRDDLSAQAVAQREELQSGLHRSSESILNMMGSVMKLQGEQVNALLQQSHENSLAFDRRQQIMQRITEDSLRRMESRAQTADMQAASLITQNDQRMEALRTAVETSLNQLRTENGQKLEEMRKTVDEKLNDTLEKRLSGSFEQVSQRLEQVYRSLGEMNTLASGVGDLKRMLGNVKTRGVWGEMQLGALLEQALTSSQYERNVAVVPALRNG